MTGNRIFDQQHYERLNRARSEVVSRLLTELQPTLKLRTAIDVGCGLGYFSGFLKSFGLEVTGVDAREENLEEAQRRNPGIRFYPCNAEDQTLTTLGTFDLVLCFGLVYHLESPLRAIRHLRTMTGSLLLIEGVIFPGEEPVMALIDEEAHDDQGLNHVAFYPTESCLVKMLYRAGFSSVLRPIERPEHPDYQLAGKRPRVRTLLAAVPQGITSSRLVQVSESASPIRPWDGPSAPCTPAQKLRVFAGKPLPEKIGSIKRIIRGRKR